jgi:MurNAc alpha-1-phosphate uridylyltransferase
MECVVLAGGLGVRMRPATELLPKALIPVAGRPFVDIQLEWLAGEGVERVVFCIGYRGEALRAHVADGERFGLAVEYVDEGTSLRGTGGALRLALDRGALAEAFLVLYGDSFLRVSLRSVWTAFVTSGQSALMTVFCNEGRWDQSNARFHDGKVVLYDKTPSRPEGLEHIDYGVSVMTRDVVEEAIPPGVVFDLATLFRELSLSNRLAGLEVQERFYEVGSPEGLRELEDYLTNGSRR